VLTSSLRFASTVLVLCSTAVLCAQSISSAPDSGLVLKTRAHEVVVDLVVTKGSEPAPGLHKQDFQVFEDGKPQSIDFFEEHSARSLPASAVATPPQMPPNVYTNVPPAPQSDAVNVLLLDSLNTPPQMIAYARKQILQYLEHVKPGTRMAIVTLNGSLNFVQGFTTDAAQLHEVALRQTDPGISPSLVTKDEVSSEQESEAFMGSNGPTGPGGTGIANTSGSNSPSGAAWSNPSAPMLSTTAVANAFANYSSYKSANRTRMTLEAVSDIARYLAAVPGRKNLIWFAADFPVYIFPRYDQRMEFEDNEIALSQVRKAADLLTSARVAVYPVYANGMMADDIISADNRSPASSVNPTRMGAMSNLDNNGAATDDRAAETEAMNQIAQDTGGKAIYNTNDLDAAIGRSVADGAHYYTLVYSPTNTKMDGHYRKIEVKLVDSRLKLSYRHGYNADEDSALAPNPKKDPDPLRQQLVHGLPEATQILFAARVVPAAPQPTLGGKIAGKNAALSGPTTRYSIDFMIRWTDVAFAAAANGAHQGKIEVGLIAWDANGKSVNWAGATQGMSFQPDVFAAIQKSGVPSHIDIDLPNKDLSLVLGVYDWGSGKAGTLEIPLHPPTATQSAAVKPN